MTGHNLERIRYIDTDPISKHVKGIAKQAPQTKQKKTKQKNPRTKPASAEKDTFYSSVKCVMFSFGCSILISGKIMVASILVFARKVT